MILDGTSSASASASAATTGQAATDKSKLDGDLNRFLTLLVSQLQHQDPLQPLDANQFTSQLVQFASIEQQIYQNANLEKLLAAQQSTQLASTVDYLGKQVEANGDALPLQNGGALASYALPQAAARATITIRDAGGRTVAVMTGNSAAGRHEVHWDGRAADGKQLPDGIYSFQVDAKDKTGNSITATQTYSGKVTGVATDSKGVQLSLGDKLVSLSGVLAVHEAPAAVAD
jgi:flagellar basal-body rod modification protein FlgD